MKLLVFSDTHHHTTAMLNCIQKESPAVVIHLGDYSEDVVDIRLAFPNLTVYNVLGNCDFWEKGPEDTEIKLNGFSFYLTHGHRYHVKSGYRELQSEGKRRCVDAVLFGHTHIPYIEKIGNTLYLNPGSSSGFGGLCFARIHLDQDIHGELVRL